MAETSGQREWQNGLCGCFSNCSLCIITFCVPCYTIGKNAEYLGDSCLTTGLLFALGFNMQPVISWRLRQQFAIKGDMITDTLLGFCCGYCEIMREAQEIRAAGPVKLMDATAEGMVRQ